MSVSEIIKEIEKSRKIISNETERISDLTAALASAPAEDWDWMPVSMASRLFYISPAKIYSKIDRGELRAKRFDSKIYISVTELKNVND